MSQEVVEQFNRVVNLINYQRFPINDEATCRAYLQILLIGAALISHVENHTVLGQSDLEVEVGDRYWFLELKFARDTHELMLFLRTLLNKLNGVATEKRGTAKNCFS